MDFLQSPLKTPTQRSLTPQIFHPTFKLPLAKYQVNFPLWLNTESCVPPLLRHHHLPMPFCPPPLLSIMGCWPCPNSAPGHSQASLLYIIQASPSTAESASQQFRHWTALNAIMPAKIRTRIHCRHCCALTLDNISAVTVCLLNDEIVVIVYPLPGHSYLCTSQRL